LKIHAFEALKRNGVEHQLQAATVFASITQDYLLINSLKLLKIFSSLAVKIRKCKK
jgi:hypothetical protein